MFLSYSFAGSEYAAPYDSAYGMPLWTYIIAVGILLYIVIRVWIALKRDEERDKIRKRKKHN